MVIIKEWGCFARQKRFAADFHRLILKLKAKGKKKKNKLTAETRRTQRKTENIGENTMAEAKEKRIKTSLNAELAKERKKI